MTKKIDPNRSYHVDLADSIKLGRYWLHPGCNIKLLGRTLEQLLKQKPKAIKSYDIEQKI